MIVLGEKFGIAERSLESRRIHRATSDLQVDLYVYVGRPCMLKSALGTEQLRYQSPKDNELRPRAVMVDDTHQRRLSRRPSAPRANSSGFRTGTWPVFVARIGRIMITPPRSRLLRRSLATHHLPKMLGGFLTPYASYAQIRVYPGPWYEAHAVSHHRKPLAGNRRKRTQSEPASFNRPQSGLGRNGLECGKGLPIDINLGSRHRREVRGTFTVKYSYSVRIKERPAVVVGVRLRLSASSRP